MLCSSDFSVTDVGDRIYIEKQEGICRDILIAKNDEKKALLERSKGPNITNDDRLRFIEAMLSDEVKSLYRASQDLLTRGALENINSVMKVIDFMTKSLRCLMIPILFPKRISYQIYILILLNPKH